MAGTSNALRILDRVTGDDPELRQLIRQETVKARVVAALARLLEIDRDLLVSNVNERSVSHKLAEHLQLQFPEWNVDCEYNRDGHNPKRLDLDSETIQTDNTSGATVYPDIIVHRGGGPKNLLVIEMKKSESDAKAVEKDLRKLRAFKEQLKYEHTMFLVLEDLNDCSGDDLDTKVGAMLNKPI